MKNRGLGPLGPSILDPVYVIYGFGARNQFRAARFVTVLIIARSMNAMEWVVKN